MMSVVSVVLIWHANHHPKFESKKKKTPPPQKKTPKNSSKKPSQTCKISL